MQPLKAVVKNGQLVMNEPTDLPEGTEIALTVTDEGTSSTMRSAPGCTNLWCEAWPRKKPANSSMQTR
jgi:hypothetical protein